MKHAKVIAAAIEKSLHGTCAFVLTNTVGCSKIGPRWISWGLGKGTPDLLVVDGPYVIWVECKDEADVLSKSQVDRLGSWITAEVPVIVARSVTDTVSLLTRIRASLYAGDYRDSAVAYELKHAWEVEAKRAKQR